jgi:hypothetical protein
MRLRGRSFLRLRLKVINTDEQDEVRHWTETLALLATWPPPQNSFHSFARMPT